MKVKRVVINKLYNMYNYDIFLNDDLNILYGENGCGKTTILNVLSSIISGKLYELFKYEFKNIILTYHNEKKNFTGKIEIFYEKNDIFKCYIDDEIILMDISDLKYSFGDKSEREIQEYMFEKYPRLKQVYYEFNCLYLPINRVNNNTLINDLDNLYNIRRNRIYHDSKYFLYKKDFNLLKVSEMIMNFYIEANQKMERVNKEFRNSLLKSLLSLDKPDLSNIFSILKEKNYLKVRKDKYLKILKENELLNASSEEKYNNLFEDLDRMINRNHNESSLSLDFLFTIAEVSKMDSIIKMADSLEKNQQIIFLPIENFCQTVNLFLENNNNEKQISIINGKIIVKNVRSNKNIDLEYLSSGEKQIITFFAYLIFGIQRKQPAIIIVDEPELSLHLHWQRSFIDRVLSVNNGGQYIFATHSPEFVGKYRNNMIKLEVL